MAAYKRSDPKKLAKERAEIMQAQREMAESQVVPESLISLAGRAIKQGVKEVRERIGRRRGRARGYGPPPQVPGAMQYGSKKPDSTA
jgi:hypothetical protein